MSKVINTLILGFISLSAMGQNPNAVYLTDSLPNYFENRIQNRSDIFAINVEGLLATNYFNKDLVFEKFWSNSIINDQINRLKTSNYAGAEGSVRLLYHAYSKNIKGSGFSPSFEMKHQAIIGTELSPNFIKLILEGNKANRDVTFSKGAHGMDLVQFSQFGFGISKRSEHQSYHFGLAFVAGNNFAKAKIQSGSIATDEQGEYIEFRSMDFLAENANGRATKGLGFSTSFRYSVSQASGTLFNISIDDLGLIRWNDLQIIKPVNESFTYEGFDITGFWENDYSVSVQDSLEGNYIETKNVPAWRVMPFKLSSGLLFDLSNQQFIHTEIRYRFVAGYLPMVSVVYGKYFSNYNGGRWLLGTEVGGFGFAALKLGLDLKLSNGAGFKCMISGVESLATNKLPVFWHVNTGLYFSI